jgi:hypothetical protein
MSAKARCPFTAGWLTQFANPRHRSAKHPQRWVYHPNLLFNPRYVISPAARLFSIRLQGRPQMNRPGTKISLSRRL